MYYKVRCVLLFIVHSSIVDSPRKTFKSYCVTCIMWYLWCSYRWTRRLLSSRMCHRVYGCLGFSVSKESAPPLSGLKISCFYNVDILLPKAPNIFRLRVCMLYSFKVRNHLQIKISVEHIPIFVANLMYRTEQKWTSRDWLYINVDITAVNLSYVAVSTIRPTFEVNHCFMVSWRVICSQFCGIFKPCVIG